MTATASLSRRALLGSASLLAFGFGLLLSGSPALADTPPAATVLAPSAVSIESAQLNGTVNPQGGPSDTAWHFEYSTDEVTWTPVGPDQALPGTDALDHQVSANLSGLERNTTYYVRLLATNAAGTTISAAPHISFTTLYGAKWRIDPLANPLVAPGEEIEYHVPITNIGDAAAPPTTGGDAANCTPGSPPPSDPAKCIRVVGEFPPGLVPVKAGGQGEPECVLTSQDVTCSYPSNVYGFDAANVGSQRTVYFTVKADQGLDPGQILTPTFRVSGGQASNTAEAVDPTTVSLDPPAFGIDAFDEAISADPSGTPATAAASHPFGLDTTITFNSRSEPSSLLGNFYPVEPLRDVIVDLPPGIAANPAGLTQCTADQLANGSFTIPRPTCPANSQLGTALVYLYYGDHGQVLGPLPLFNMVPPPDAPARLGFNVLSSLITLDAFVRSDGDFGLRTSAVNLSEVGIKATAIKIWGVPSDPIHLRDRACPGSELPHDSNRFCPNDDPPRAFFRNPTSCGEPGAGLLSTASIDSWEHPGAKLPSGFPDLSDPNWKSLSVRSHEAPGYPHAPSEWGPQVGITGCEEIPFTPEISVAPTTDVADSSSGLEVDLTVPQDCWQAGQVDSLCQADLRGAEVTLPAGLTLNSSAATGVMSCSPAQIGLTTPVGQPDPVHFTDQPAHCPDAAKIGTVSIDTPLLGANESPEEEDLKGSLYLASQTENPFGSLLAAYLVAEGHGVIIKQAGEISIGPDGRLTTRFGEAPQQPFTHLHLELFGGPRGELKTPSACGTYTTEATLAPWSGNAPQHLSSSFTITSGPGGPCPSGSFDPTLHAGTANPLGGAFSPFALRLTRADGSAELGGLSATLPPGLIGKLAGVSICPDSALAAVSGALGSGAVQAAGPSCPASSLVGKVTVGAGAGPTPFFTELGRLYLAGPYKGSPYSLAAVVPAVAGPFDLGSVVVRNALRIDPVTSQITTTSDSLPSELFGIPLDLRDIRVDVNRDEFTLNPTSCDEMAIAADLTSLGGAHAARTERFQAAGCDRLAFKPKLSLRLKGSTKRTSNPSLIASLKARPGDANISRAKVTLPKAAFLDNSHIKTICTRAQFAAGTCPAGSIYGKASAITPLLDYPLTGPVYLRSSSHQLPDLVVSLKGPGATPLEIDLSGRTDSVKGALRNTFEAVPDAPVTKFTLTLFGGKRGLVELSSGFCAHPKATVKLDGQNGKTYDTNPTVASSCPKKSNAHKHERRAHK